MNNNSVLFFGLLRCFDCSSAKHTTHKSKLAKIFLHLRALCCITMIAGPAILVKHNKLQTTLKLWLFYYELVRFMVCRPEARGRDGGFPSFAQGTKPSRRVAVLMGFLTELLCLKPLWWKTDKSEKSLGVIIANTLGLRSFLLLRFNLCDNDSRLNAQRDKDDFILVVNWYRKLRVTAKPWLLHLAETSEFYYNWF